jgi:hypothetical protein
MLHSLSKWFKVVFDPAINQYWRNRVYQCVPVHYTRRSGMFEIGGVAAAHLSDTALISTCALWGNSTA